MRVFIAIFPPKQVQGTLRDFQMKAIDSLGIKTTQTDQFHLTLQFFGHVSDSEVEVLDEKLRKIAETERGFSVTMDKIVPFPDEKGSILAGAVQKSKELERLCKLLPREPGAKPFNPHITIIRGKKQGIGRQKLATPFLSLTWRANQIHLVKSTLTKEGPIHTILQSYDLQ